MSTEQDSVQRLAEIRERAEKATPGPWEFEHEDYVSYMYFGSANAGEYPAQRAPIHRDTDFTDQQADEARSTVEFIAHSREDVPCLLSIIDSLGNRIAEYERQDVVWVTRDEAAWLDQRADIEQRIDSLTAERDEHSCAAEVGFEQGHDAARKRYAARAEAAEAEVKRLREALMAHHEAGVLARTVGVETHQAWGMRCPFCAAASATPPSEGGQS